MLARSVCWIGAACRSSRLLIARFCRPRPKKMKPMKNMATAAAAEPMMTRIMSASHCQADEATPLNPMRHPGEGRDLETRSPTFTGLTLTAADHLADEVVQEYTSCC